MNENIQNVQYSERNNIGTSLGKLFLIFIVSFVILELLASFILSIFHINQFTFASMVYEDYKILWIINSDKITKDVVIFYFLQFIYFFLHSYIASYFAIKDTFRKGRCVGFENETKLKLLIAVLFPILYSIVIVLININQINNYNLIQIVMLYLIITLSKIISIFINTRKFNVC